LLLHLHSKLSHHLCRLSLILVSLDLSFDFIGVEVSSLISLRESVMVSDSRAIVTETSKVALGSLLFLDSDSHDFNLIVSKADLKLKLVRHHKLISLNRIVVILLLFSDLVAFLPHHLLLHLLLLELLQKRKITLHTGVTKPSFLSLDKALLTSSYSWVY